MQNMTNKSKLHEDLRRRDDQDRVIGGAASHIDVKIKGEQRRYWYAIGDAAQAIKKIEQDLHDNCPDNWTAFRELWITGGGATASGLLCIADDPIESIRLFGSRLPYFMIDLNREPSRNMLSQYLGEDLGKYGTSDLII